MGTRDGDRRAVWGGQGRTHPPRSYQHHSLPPSPAPTPAPSAQILARTRTLSFPPVQIPRRRAPHAPAVASAPSTRIRLEILTLGAAGSRRPCATRSCFSFSRATRRCVRSFLSSCADTAGGTVSGAADSAVVEPGGGTVGREAVYIQRQVKAQLAAIRLPACQPMLGRRRA